MRARHVGILVLGAAVGMASPAPAAGRPNVVVFLADDQGWGDLGASGNTNLRTPHIDSLARDGASFERFYVQPVCSPTRAEFLTGRYHPRGRVSGVTSGGERLDLGERTVADRFRAAGYATGCFGKWHNGSQYPYHPRGRGFDEYYGFTSGHWGDYFGPPLDHDGRTVKGTGYLPDDLTDHAIGFIEKNKGRPFFCYVPFNTPHSPMQVPDKFYDRFRDAPITLRAAGPLKEDLPTTRAALAMVENLDGNVGRVLAKLAELKLADGTVVLYFSDNGPAAWRWNGGMRGKKGTVDEGGVRSPLLVRWPGKVRAGTVVKEVAGSIDLLPTLAELAGLPAAEGKPLDGRSLAPLLKGESVDWPDRPVFARWGGRVSARTRQYRLGGDGKLYDMTADPGQTRDVSADRPEVAARLAKAVEEWKRDVLPPAKADDRPFPVGYREFPTTPLPARDGVPHGGVRRSAQAPNCSYFTRWTGPGDSVTWDVEVATAGRYEAEVLVTVPATGVGTAVELNLGESTARATLAEVHDPPARGAEHDRVPRGSESYVKDFRPLRLGAMDLKAGRGLLTLRTPDARPGKPVMDVRGVALTLAK